MKRITSDLTKKFHRYMMKTYHFDIIDKPNAYEMQIAARFVSQFTSIGYEDFLKKYSTTVGNRVYIPYTIGKGNHYQLFNQICTITHEARHVKDFRRNPADMGHYLICQRKRTEIEYRAYSTYLYLYWWRYGKLPNIWKVAQKLSNYGVGAEHVKVMYKCLRMQTPIIKRDRIANSVAKTAITWLKRNCK